MVWPPLISLFISLGSTAHRPKFYNNYKWRLTGKKMSNWTAFNSFAILLKNLFLVGNIASSAKAFSFSVGSFSSGGQDFWRTCWDVSVFAVSYLSWVRTAEMRTPAAATRIGPRTELYLRSESAWNISRSAVLRLRHLSGAVGVAREIHLCSA